MESAARGLEKPKKLRGANALSFAAHSPLPQARGNTKSIRPNAIYSEIVAP